ncbi:hypothetical protein PTSG_05148 [Salpingoeca rosetta]|uniref:AB hydrolase-1 domain-containing protein n=1 Tax=Salpingoeca rosetta (strain ATCC 50818 / BSB-021) TaxID=946362 RepID=F2UAM8_SALR5|nr:uncharacterized protein PTSG_05148 [Salpingoeca rosetta]EGD73444.1 hypothetical protein PTSG_05148 [Salpingoeca rosetta]|eukprot:XP_004993726.1 hypothetical protein PTSG_05148 [Salpingoeca rosetta]
MDLVAELLARTTEVVRVDDLLGVEDVPAAVVVFAAVCGSVLLLLARTVRASKVDMHYVPTPSNKAVVHKLRQHTTLTRYKPPRLLTNAHTSTLFAALGKRPPMPKFHREHLDTPDGGLIGLDILEPPARGAADAPPLTVLLVPGIASCSDAPYIRSLALACHEHGWRTVVKNWRGCKTELRSARTFNYGNTEDIELAIRYIKRMYPAGPIVAVAFSMGANVLTKYMGTTNEDLGSDLYHSIDAAVTYSNGYILQWGYEMLHQPHFRPYHLALLFWAKEPWKQLPPEQFEQSGLPFTKDELLAASTLAEFDKLHLPAIYGYSSLEEFAQAESSGTYLHRIRRPFLTVNARNDPLFPEQAEEFVRKHATDNEHIIFVLTEWGGHVGWDKNFFQHHDADEHHNVMDEITTTFFHHVLHHTSHFEEK